MKIGKHATRELEQELDCRRNEPVYETTKQFVFFLEGEPVIITEATVEQYEDRVEFQVSSFPQTQQIDGVVVGGRLITTGYPNTVFKGSGLTFTVDWPAL